MNFKIGFTADANRESSITEVTPVTVTTPQAKKSVVRVFFPDRSISCSYYNDSFDLHRGDIVYVEGKLAGLRGRVQEVSYSFKIKLSEYKRVVGVADTDIRGQFYLAGTHIVTVNENALPFEKAVSWFRAPEPETEEYIFGTDETCFLINNPADMVQNPEIAARGQDYYLQNRVAYLEINHGKGRAIVEGGENYLVEFEYNHNEIKSPVCSCFCSGICKHEIAAMLQLKETLEFVEQNYPSVISGGYLAAIRKTTFFEFAVDTKASGSFSLE